MHLFFTFLLLVLAWGPAMESLGMGAQKGGDGAFYPFLPFYPFTFLPFYFFTLLLFYL